jgi:hypothetical protein
VSLIQPVTPAECPHLSVPPLLPTVPLSLLLPFPFFAPPTLPFLLLFPCFSSSLCFFLPHPHSFHPFSFPTFPSSFLSLLPFLAVVLPALFSPSSSHPCLSHSSPPPALPPVLSASPRPSSRPRLLGPGARGGLWEMEARNPPQFGSARILPAARRSVGRARKGVDCAWDSGKCSLAPSAQAHCAWAGLAGAVIVPPVARG